MSCPTEGKLPPAGPHDNRLWSTEPLLFALGRPTFFWGSLLMLGSADDFTSVTQMVTSLITKTHQEGKHEQINAPTLQQDISASTSPSSTTGSL